MLLGYARVSTEEQNTDMQVAALKQAGCEKFFIEVHSGGRWERPELHKLLEQLRPSDVLVVWKLDRLSRSLKDTLSIMEMLHKAEAGFKSLTENIDTTTPAGKMLMQMLALFAEYEREMIRERVKTGLREARKKGVAFGRPSAFTPEQQALALEMIEQGKRQAEVARAFNVHRSLICRLVQQKTFDQETRNDCRIE